MSLEVIDWLLEKNHNKILTVSSIMVIVTRLDIVTINQNSFNIDRIAKYYSYLSILIWVLFIVLTILGCVYVKTNILCIGVIKDVFLDAMVVLYVCTCLCDLVIYDEQLSPDLSVLIMALCYTSLFVIDRLKEIIKQNKKLIN